MPMRDGRDPYSWFVQNNLAAYLESQISKWKYNLIEGGKNPTSASPTDIQVGMHNFG